MKKLVILVLLSLLSASCSTLRRGYVKNTGPAEPSIKDYVLDFKNLTRSSINKYDPDRIKIKMGDLKKPSVGLCWYMNIPPEINIDRAFWARASTEEKEVLVFHELGHCSCFLGHTYNGGEYKKDEEPKGDLTVAGFLEDGCPSSLMYPYVIPQICYERHRLHYRYELSRQCRED